MTTAAGGVSAVLDDVFARIKDNITRVSSLVTVYKGLYGTGSGRRSVRETDLLRAAVVFLHASLEDYLRSISRIYLPTLGAKTIDHVPLVGLDASGRPGKFYLGSLVQHRGKSVDSVISESVEQYLERTNYNSTTEIASLLSDLGVSGESVEAFYSSLDSLMSRRHQIVHRADRVEKVGRGVHRASPINPALVDEWIKTVSNFITTTLAELVSGDAAAARSAKASMPTITEEE